jgi:hypothetical protein
LGLKENSEESLRKETQNKAQILVALKNSLGEKILNEMFKLCHQCENLTKIASKIPFPLD